MKRYLIAMALFEVFGILSASDLKDGTDIVLRQVSIQMSRIHHCGGSILDKKTVLLAAHCFYGYPISTFTVLVGSNLSDTSLRHHQVLDIATHKYFTPNALENDIAIVKLYTPIAFNEFVKPILLNTNFVQEFVGCVLQSWRFGLNGYARSTLQSTDLVTTNNMYCQRWFEKTILYSQLCAIPISKDKACVGDVGSPLIVDGKQIGIVSWMRACNYGFPNIFTRVSSFVRWIEANRM